MSTATGIHLNDIRRVAAANCVTERRAVKAAEDAGVVLHSINGRTFVEVSDEDKISKHLGKREER